MRAPRKGIGEALTVAREGGGGKGVVLPHLPHARQQLDQPAVEHGKGGCEVQRGLSSGDGGYGTLHAESVKESVVCDRLDMVAAAVRSTTAETHLEEGCGQAEGVQPQRTCSASQCQEQKQGKASGALALGLARL